MGKGPVWDWDGGKKGELLAVNPSEVSLLGPLIKTYWFGTGISKAPWARNVPEQSSVQGQSLKDSFSLDERGAGSYGGFTIAQVYTSIRGSKVTPEAGSKTTDPILDS